MNNIIYRVIIKVSYNDAYFEFNDSEEACKFATSALQHMVGCDDTKKRSYVAMLVVDVDAEKKEEEDD